MTLQAVGTRPWQAYMGYTNDGSPATGRDRFFLGGAVGNLLLQDSVAALQLTGSSDAVVADRFPRYESAALTYEATIGPGRVESLFDAVFTYQPTDDFVSGTEVLEGSLGYRLPVNWPWLGDASTDLRFGFEGNHQTRKIFFGGVKAYEVAMDVGQIYLGLQQTQDWGDIDLAVHVSPGGITEGNSDAQAYLYSLGRMKSTSYAYVTFGYDRQTDLGFGQWVVNLAGQYSPDVLPFTGQSGLGGMSLVRGYSLENGAFDSSLTFRNELRFPSRPVSVGEAAPYLFADAGLGRDNYARHTEGAASLGGGMRIYAFHHATLNALGGVALMRNGDIDAGDGFLRMSLTVDF